MYDCRGFTRWLLQQAGIDLEGQGATSQWNTEKNWAVRGEIRDLPKERVACIFKQDKDGKTMNHTGMHIGDGKIVHCSSGVQTGKITQRGWTHFAIPVGLYDSSALPPTPVYRPTLKRGCKGDQVVFLQEILFSQGYDLGPCGIDGNFGRKTRAAVKAFQADRGLKADGIVGPMTYGKLYPEEG